MKDLLLQSIPIGETAILITMFTLFFFLSGLKNAIYYTSGSKHNEAIYLTTCVAMLIINIPICAYIIEHDAPLLLLSLLFVGLLCSWLLQIINFLTKGKTIHIVEQFISGFAHLILFVISHNILLSLLIASIQGVVFNLPIQLMCFPNKYKTFKDWLFTPHPTDDITGKTVGYPLPMWLGGKTIRIKRFTYNGFRQLLVVAISVLLFILA